MDIVSTLFQIIIPLGIFNVWLLRAGQSTAYRGSNSPDLKAEFAAYGLPTWAFYVVGTLKLSAATLLLLGFIVPALILPGAIVMAILMTGALAMHAKVSDPFTRYIPALLMLLMSLVLIF